MRVSLGYQEKGIPEVVSLLLCEQGKRGKLII
jgi:hypothetical protein